MYITTDFQGTQVFRFITSIPKREQFLKQQQLLKKIEKTFKYIQLFSLPSQPWSRFLLAKVRPWNHSSLLACSHQLCFYDFFVGSDRMPPQKSTLLHWRQAVSSPQGSVTSLIRYQCWPRKGSVSEDWGTRKKGVFTNWTDFWHQILRSYWLKSPMEEMCHIGCKECDSPNDSWQNASLGFAFARERHPWLQRNERFIIFVGEMGQSKVQSPFIARGIGKKPCRGWQFWLTELSGLSK